MTKKDKDYFTCVICNQTYEKEQSDEEANQECLELFGVTPADCDCDYVCDDCFQLIRPDKIFTKE
jgi:hypothetical protein